MNSQEEALETIRQYELEQKTKKNLDSRNRSGCLISGEQVEEKLLKDRTSKKLDTDSSRVDEDAALQVLYEVCYSVFEASEMHSLACNHEFCKQCVTDYLSSEVMNGSSLKLSCMQMDCIKKYTEEHVEIFCTDKLLEVYKKVQSDA